LPLDPGHAANVAFAKKLKKGQCRQPTVRVRPKYNPSLPPVMDINKITATLPHRYPFLLIDKIIYLDNESVAGVKNVTMNEPFLSGTFSGKPGNARRAANRGYGANRWYSGTAAPYPIRKTITGRISWVSTSFRFSKDGSSRRHPCYSV
jgi:hypothetical protein